MQIFVPFLIVSSVIGFHKGFHKLILGGVVLMDCLSCLKHLALDYELGYGGFLFGRFKQVCRFLGLFLLFGFGLKFILSDNFCSGFLVRLLCGLNGKSANFKKGFCSKNILDRKFRLFKFSKEDSSVPFLDEMEMEKIENSTDFDGETKTDSDNDEEDGELDITTLRELLRIERQKVNAVRAELAKERAASATAAEEAMAMILRLQNEKSLIEMEWSQHRRLAEEKQIHDQEVIRSLQWLVRQHEFDTSLLEEAEEAEFEEARSSSNGNIIEALENVLYSSRDSDNLLP
ncbi:hypothetical protein C2S51_004870 [Perilla frutescens var. frutescens]|nr:hypothetical protein C2S51_004870 [Perilla frutescens var. frutescens]